MANITPIGPWIDPVDAVDVARRGIHDYGLDRDPIVAFTIQNGCPMTPLLVERVDKREQAYYLIPWLITEGVVFVAEVDAASGVMLGATTFSKPAPSPFLTIDEAFDIVGRKFPQRATGESRLVWRPCRESTSPMYPFYQIPFDKGFLYVNMEGSIFTELTPLDLGGGSCP
jgi:hypothetical protein